MSNSKDIIVKLRLLVKPPINIKNFYYKVTYTKFGYQNKDGTHTSPKTINNAFIKFTANPSANKNGLLAIDSEAIVLLQHNSNIKKISFPDAKNGSAWFQIENRSNGKVVKKSEYPQWSYRNERKTHQYLWDTTSSKNSTTPDTQKTQKIPLTFPFVIAKSASKLHGNDSKHSSGLRLPSKYYTANGNFYTMSKEALLEELIDLMEWGSTGEAETVAVEMANKFATNTKYSESNAYSNDTLIEIIRESDAFKNYLNDIAADFKAEISRVRKIKQGQLIFANEIRRFNFRDTHLNFWKSGLIITLHDLSYIKIILTDVKYSGTKPVELTTTFVLYDTYGLDMPDIEKFGMLDSSVSGSWESFKKRNIMQQTVSSTGGAMFNIWWILQFYHGCVPLFVKLRINNVKISL